ncbi:MAG: hypothetical protein KBB54_03600 [Candidatus Pacebacteria bacterium]|nr:hypothetical protein [Candidatus Paceibacterota bacterium]MBP9818741.1 hypothetical protein [Candidatus Paceibacterota bacterium]
MKKSSTKKAQEIKKLPTWDFTDLYSGPTDTKLDADIQSITIICKKFSKKYKDSTDYLKEDESGAEALLKALKDWETLTEDVGTARPLWYLQNLQSIESNNPAISAKLGLLEPIATGAMNEILFFSLKLGKLSLEWQNKLLADQRFAHFKYFLERLFISAKHNLTEDAEKVYNLLSRPSYTLWVEGFEKLLNEQTVVFKGKTIPLSKALSQVHQLPTADRRKLNDICMQKLSTISYFAEQELNAVYTTKKISDELRGFAKPYSETIIGYENDEKSIENLVKVVSDNFPVAHRFFKLKAKLMKLKTLEYCDRAVGVAKKQKEIQFDEAVEILKTAFGQANPRYVEILEMMLKNKKIDVPSRVGKRGGAYCWGGATVPTVVLLNYVPSVDAVMTFAHEMGHAIHTEFSKKPSALYEHYTISVAEVASTFFENLAFQELFSKMNDTEKIYALYDRIADDMSNIFRQIACFNFELDLHEQIRVKGALTVKGIGATHNKQMSRYLGPAVKMKESDGFFFEPWSHIRSFFYVYSYAYGQIISKALFKKCKEDKSFYKKVDQFLEAGKTMSPDQIFQSIGINTLDPKFFESGIRAIVEDIDTLEKLMKKNKMM